MATSGRKYCTIVTHITCGLLAPRNCDGLRPPNIVFLPSPEKKWPQNTKLFNVTFPPNAGNKGSLRSHDQKDVI